MKYTRICVKLFDRFNEEEKYQTNNLELMYHILDLNENNILEQYHFDKITKRFKSYIIGSISKHYYQAMFKYRTAKRTLKTGTQHDHT